MENHKPIANEVLISKHDSISWMKRARERTAWLHREKVRIREKEEVLFGADFVDAEMLPALQAIHQIGLTTEYSCAGVSPLDEPEDHSLYAYVTIIHSEKAEAFVQYLMEKMRHRVQVILEPARGRYDISSYLIQHNRSFCLLLHHYAMKFKTHTSLKV